MKNGCILLLVGVAGCVFQPNWHWEKPGASEEQYAADINQCKLATYSGTSGIVTGETVGRMHACMEMRGWRKTSN